MKKFLILIFLFPTLLSACALNTIDMYKDEINEVTQDPKSRKLTEDESDINHFNKCPILREISKWDTDGRYESWKDGNMHTDTGVGLDLSVKYFKNLNMILNDKSIHPIYLGPWHYSPRIKKQIRFFAYTGIEGGDIQYQYESMTDENKNIPEKKFSLPPNSKIPPDRFGLCVVKWTAKYGYNAIAEVKSKNPFSKDYLVPTGRIIEVKE